jgi:hypothetical protein
VELRPLGPLLRPSEEVRAAVFEDIEPRGADEFLALLDTSLYRIATEIAK